MNTAVVVITGSYPFPLLAEDTFLQHEVRALAGTFDSVHVVPLRAVGEQAGVPHGVKVDTSLSRMRGSVRRRAGAVVSACVTPGVLTNVTGKDRPPSDRRALLRTAIAMSDALLVRDWLRRFASADHASGRFRIAYSYWCGGTTLGGLLARKAGDVSKVVTRVHGADLYPWRHSPPFLPFQRAIVTQADRVFPISNDGARFLIDNYEIPADRIKVSRLGVADPGGVAEQSEDGVWRLASCSYLVPVKRVGLIARVVGRLASLAPRMKIEWQHLGGGPGEAELLKTTERILPPNARFQYRGSVSNQEVVRAYLDQPNDLFINLSESEGIPVAAMEAISAGIPVFALDVGGMREIVTDKNGCLLAPTLGAEQIADALLAHLSDKSGLRKRAIAARAVWAERYDANRNFQTFAGELLKLCEQSTVG